MKKLLIVTLFIGAAQNTQGIELPSSRLMTNSPGRNLLKKNDTSIYPVAHKVVPKFKNMKCKSNSDCGSNELCRFGDGWPPSSWCVVKKSGDCTQSSDCSTGKSCIMPPPGGGNIGHCGIARTSHPGTHRPPVNNPAGPGATPSGGGANGGGAYPMPGECINPNGCSHDGEAI